MSGGMEPGAVLSWITGISTVVIGAWTLFGKSKDSSYTRLEGERNRLDSKVAELESQQREQAERLDKVEAELGALRLDHKTLLDFLREICAGRYDYDWVRGRAQDLLTRFGGGGT